MPRNELREETKVAVGTMVPFSSGTVPTGYMVKHGESETVLLLSTYQILVDSS
jgi:hypothetical protein